MIQAEMNQALLRGGQHYPASRLRQALRFVERVVGKRTYAVSIAFVSPSAMRQANRRYRKKDRVTDVLSFSLSDHLGELLICYSQAKRQAREMGHSIRDEITFLLVHGLLHLFGHDHERSTQAKRMFNLQEKILQALRVDSRL
ncbi:rRNA maturation RNase YbeY [Candidatus Uhrbacteria bacterium]|nr:rRNA maturation RNase YbeY [Candidatus Uhrbacteria bacterium]